MTVPKLKTTVLLTIEGCEIERDCWIEHRRVPAYDGGREEPSSDAYCEVTGVEIRSANGNMLDAAWLVDELDASDDVKAALMGAWVDDEAAAEEYRADAAREDRWLERAVGQWHPGDEA